MLFDESVRLRPSADWKLPVISAMTRAQPCPEMVLPSSQLAHWPQIDAMQSTHSENLKAHIEAGNKEVLQRELPDLLMSDDSDSAREVEAFTTAASAPARALDAD